LLLIGIIQRKLVLLSIIRIQSCSSTISSKESPIIDLAPIAHHTTIMHRTIIALIPKIHLIIVLVAQTHLIIALVVQVSHHGILIMSIVG